MAFNLKKQAQIDDPFGDMMYDVPFGVNPVAAKYLWENIYREDPTMDSMQDMISQLGPENIQEEYERMSDPAVVNDLPDSANNMQNVNEQMQDTFGSIKKKTFNLKKAQMQVPFDSMGLNDAPEMMGDQLERQQDVEPFKKYKTHSDLNNFLLQMSNRENAFQFAWNDIQNENPKEPDSAQSALKGYFQNFDTKGEEQLLDEANIIHKLIYGKEEPMSIQAPYKEVGASVSEASELIKKLAQDIVNKNRKKAFNLTKTAQHKTMDNAILWGPGQTRIDPFLHQPVSDWHIVERNKGFGLVVDDVWNIDYETIWRENVMDKYSRPYKDKEGNWVGGYLNKRFEIDRNIPEASNMQLKPGQLRKPILPEYGNTESRLQAARAAGDIAGADDTSKPYNWKEASKKKS